MTKPVLKGESCLGSFDLMPKLVHDLTIIFLGPFAMAQSVMDLLFHDFLLFVSILFHSFGRTFVDFTVTAYGLGPVKWEIPLALGTFRRNADRPQGLCDIHN